MIFGKEGHDRRRPWAAGRSSAGDSRRAKDHGAPSRLKNALMQPEPMRTRDRRPASSRASPAWGGSHWHRSPRPPSRGEFQRAVMRLGRAHDHVEVGVFESSKVRAVARDVDADLSIRPSRIRRFAALQTGGGEIISRRSNGGERLAIGERTCSSAANRTDCGRPGSSTGPAELARIVNPSMQSRHQRENAAKCLAISILPFTVRAADGAFVCSPRRPCRSPRCGSARVPNRGVIVSRS